MLLIQIQDVEPRLVYILGCWYGALVSCERRGQTISLENTRAFAGLCQAKNQERADTLSTPLLQKTNHLAFADPERQFAFYCQGYEDGQALIEANLGQFIGPNRPIDVVFPLAISSQIQDTFSLDGIPHRFVTAVASPSSPM